MANLSPDRLDSDLLNYIIAKGARPGDRLPSLDDLSKELKISTGKLREQLEVARALGLVEVRPNRGIRIADYSFLAAIRLSLLYVLGSDPGQFQAFGQLRNEVEAAFWYRATIVLRRATSVANSVSARRNQAASTSDIRKFWETESCTY